MDAKPRLCEPHARGLQADFSLSQAFCLGHMSFERVRHNNVSLVLAWHEFGVMLHMQRASDHNNVSHVLAWHG